MLLVTLLTLMLQQTDYAPGRAGLDPLDSAREARVQRLGSQLRCPVCQGSSIADSPSSMARAQLDKVRELVAEGKSDDEIYAYFVARYGEWALLSPKKDGITGVLWVAPVLMLGFGALFLFLRKTAKPAAAALATTPSPDDADPFLSQVRKDLQQ